jgi:hypothetical protein
MKTKQLTLFRSIPWKRDWLWILVIFLCLRVVISGIAVATLWHADPPLPVWMTPNFPGDPALLGSPAAAGQGIRLLLSGWYRWDTAWFMKVAASGYAPSDGSLSFMPLYPLVIRFVQWIVGGKTLLATLLAALLVSNVFCIAGLILFYEVMLLELGSRAQAWQAFLYLMSFPAAFFLIAGYSESLFLTLSLATWLLIRRGRWSFAALTSALAVLTRLQGLALAVPLAWQAVAVAANADALAPAQEFRAVITFLKQKAGWLILARGWKKPVWAAALFPPIAFLLFNLGSRWAGLSTVASAYSGRESSLAFPWQGFAEFVNRIFTYHYSPQDYIDLPLFVAVVAVTVICLPKVRPALSLYVIALLVMVFSRSYGVAILSGFMRFVLTTFPFFLCLAKMNLSRPVKLLLVPVFWAAQLLMAWMFISWLWVA